MKNLKDLRYISEFKNNKIISQKKYYPGPHSKQILKHFDIWKYWKLREQFLKPLVINKFPYKGNYSSYEASESNCIQHVQENILIFNVDHEQEEYAIIYEKFENGEIYTNKDEEFIQILEEKIQNNYNTIIEDISKNYSLSEQEVETISKGLKNYNKYDNTIKYKNTIGIQKNNLTTSPKYNSIKIYESNEKNLFIYMKKGLIQINRNDNDYIRSIVDITTNYKDNKGLQKHNINEKNHQIVASEILKAIGGYKNIKYYEEVKTKEDVVKVLVCALMYLKKIK